MKSTHLSAIFASIIFWGGAIAISQVEGEEFTGTEITSNTFRLDLSKSEGLFTGEVRVTDKKFNLESEELTVYFDEDNQVKRLVARGDVKIFQGESTTATSREAEFILADSALKLTGDPVVTQDGSRITGTLITIYTDTDRMDVEGRSKAQFFLDE
ncbi:MAG: LptA/OstA family protein [Verrucomicrobiota bacterium]